MLSERKAQAAYVVRRRAVLGDRDWYRSEFFNEHQRAHGLDDQLYSVRPLGHGRVEGIGVTREVSDPPFSDEDQNLLELFHEQLALRDRARRQPEDGPRLTPRESDVLRCLLAGAAEKAVAADLGISPQTVHTHVKSIYSAYGVSSRAELLAHCLTAPGGHTSA
jgi:DNA-binding CsgD family transcriptional regulator